ncbi:MAG: pilus (MSHA type) biogenesis protein MshL [Gammaproteobacteria bacterium]
MHRSPLIRTLQATTLAALALLLLACENPAPRVDTLGAIDTVLKDGAAEHRDGDDVPPDVANELIPTLRLDVPAVPEIIDAQRFDIAVNDVPAVQFFMSLIDGTDYNMVVHPEVTGHISLNLKNVTIPDVLEAARDVYGFEFEKTPYGFQVLPARLEARVYQINYLNVARSGTSATFVSSGTLQEGPGANNISDSAVNDGQFSSDGRGQRTVVGTQISTVHPETSFWRELQSSLEAIVGDGEGRSVVVNPQSGVVVARAIPTELREIEAFLRATQLIAQRQVILEAKILEVELSAGFQSGINWASVLGSFTLGHTGGGTNLVGESGLSDLAGLAVDQFPGQTAIGGVPASAFGGVFSLAVSGSDFTAFVELLESQGNVQVLSSPRIATMNNQKAIIKVGTDEFFVTDVSTTTITSNTTQTTPNIELTPFFSGIALDVTPQISESGEVMLHVHPTVSQVRDQQKNIAIGGLNQTLPLARSTVRESDSIVRAKSGQLVVIGGLMQDRDTEQDAKTPGLGDLPGVGALFRHKRTESTKSELVILLRPIVLEGDQQWADAFGQTGANVDRLETELADWKARRHSGIGYGKPDP